MNYGSINSPLLYKDSCLAQGFDLIPQIEVIPKHSAKHAQKGTGKQFMFAVDLIWSKLDHKKLKFAMKSLRQKLEAF